MLNFSWLFYDKRRDGRNKVVIKNVVIRNVIRVVIRNVIGIIIRNVIKNGKFWKSLDVGNIKITLSPKIIII